MSNVITFPSSFGAANTTSGPDKFSARTMLESARYKELDRNESYYACTQHDWKRYDFDGRMIQLGAATQPLLSTEKAPFWVPLRQRRPSTPYRIGKSIVDAFSSLLFGEERWPKIGVDGDEDGQAFREACVRVSDMPLKLMMGRDIGGSVGTVGYSWCFRNGRPCVDVHNGKHLFPHEWADRQKLVPAHVTECYQYPIDEYDAEKRRYVRNYYWHRRDWTMDAEIFYKPVLVHPSREPEWENLIDEDRTVTHGDGDCHFVWVQNVPTTGIDGLPDYHGLYDPMDSLDIVCSVIYRATTLNLDPTVVLNMDPDIVSRMGIKKGSDNALVVGEEGDAKYMEITGAGIEAGIKFFGIERKKILETGQCVLPDPDEIAASGQSSLAQKVVYRPMLARSSVHRAQYGNAIKALLDSMARIARRRMNELVDVKDDEGNVTGQTVAYVDLPKRVETEDPPTDPETGQQTGEDPVQTEVEQSPGEAEECDLTWGDWFPPTAADKAQMATTLTAATAGAAFLSPQSATEEAARAFGLDPAEEWKRMQAAQKITDLKEQKQQDAMNDALSEGAGGKVPPGGAPKPGAAKPPGGAKPGSSKPGDGDDVDLSDLDKD